VKALSILQPWACLIVNGQKDIENRSWRTTMRGRILVHAGKGMDWDAMDAPHVERALRGCGLIGLDRGGIVGEVEIIDCVRDHPSRWKDPQSWGFVLRNARALPFMPCRGKLGFFDVDLP
jgi:hypothetical protein